MNERDFFQVGENLVHQRIDLALSELYPQQSRTYFQKLIQEGLVKVNGTPVKKCYQLRPQDQVDVEFILCSEIKLEAQDIPLDIIFEDEHLLLVNKTPGMVVHPAPGNWSHTFVNALLYHCKNSFLHKNDDRVRPGIVHRLDKETSGLLIAAKNSKTQALLSQLFLERKVEKTYIAIALGNPGILKIEAPILRHPKKRKEMTISPKGRPAITYCKPLAYNEQLSVLELEPKTGRTHQIRIHMKHQGNPLLGDSLYGNSMVNKKYPISRHMLHAYALKFTHPITNQELFFRAPIPKDMTQMILNIQKELNKELLCA